MIALIMWQNGANIGHFLVLDGFYKGTNGTDYITYMDPWYDHYNHNFSTFHTNNFCGVKLFIISMQPIILKAGVHK